MQGRSGGCSKAAIAVHILGLVVQAVAHTDIVVVGAVIGGGVDQAGACR